MLFRHILRLPITYFKSSSEGAIMSKIINDTSKMQWLITGAPSSILGQPFKLAALFVIALWINVKLGLVLIFFLPLSYTVIRFSYKRISMNNKKILALSEQLYSFLEQKLYGLEIVKTLTMEKTEVSLYEKMNNEIFHADLRQYRSQAILLPAQNLLMGACVIFILWAGTGEVHSGIISPGSFAVFGAVAFSIYAILNKIGRTYTRFQIAYQSAERVFDILDLDCEPSGGISFPGDFMNIKISGLTFSYSKDIPVLNNISMNINRGETILINGPSGLGKTTVLRLLLRFYEPSAGEIRINNIPLFKDYVYPKKKDKILDREKGFLFIGFLLLFFIYAIYKKGKK
jgi:ABC-type multidrug transport system fused ATPase/permease subunit